MDIVQITVTGNVTFAEGSENGGAGSVTALLSKKDRDVAGVLISPKIATGAMDAAGLWSVDHWPNARGIEGSTVTLTVDPGAGGKAMTYDGLILPDIPGGTITLDALLDMQAALKTATGTTTAYLTQADYNTARDADPAFGKSRIIGIV